jgi:hypothetical protein
MFCTNSEGLPEGLPDAPLGVVDALAPGPDDGLPPGPDDGLVDAPLGGFSEVLLGLLHPAAASTTPASNMLEASIRFRMAHEYSTHRVSFRATRSHPLTIRR